MARTAGPRWRFLLVGWLVMAAVFALIGRGLDALSASEVRQTADWQPVAARVVDASVSRGRDDYKGRTSYTPVIAYRYTVGGVAYESHRVFFDGPTAPQYVAERLVQRYPAGRSVTAYVDPTKPTNAILVRDRTSAVPADAASSGYGVAFGFMSVFTVFFLFAKLAPNRPLPP